MKLTIDRDAFAHTLAWVNQVAPRRPAVPVLAGVHIDTDGETTTVRATDFETWHTATVDADVTDPGSALVSAHRLRDVIRNATSEKATLATEGTDLVVRCGRSTYKLRSLPVEEYPREAALDEPTATGTTTADDLRQLLDTVAPGVSRDDSLPLLTGVHLLSDGDTLTGHATDRYTASLATVGFAGDPDQHLDAVVAHRSAFLAAKALTDTVIVTTTGSQVALADETRTAIISTLTGNFPQVARLVPDYSTETDQIVVTCDAAELAGACTRLAALVDRTVPIVVLTAKDQADTVKCQVTDDDHGDGVELVDATVTGAGSICFNARYLADALQATPQGPVELVFVDRDKPARLRSSYSDRTTHILMPIRRT